MLRNIGSAIILARKDKLDLSIGNWTGSGTQVALFVVPVLVIAGIIMGRPFSLVFTILELAACLPCCDNIELDST